MNPCHLIATALAAFAVFPATFVLATEQGGRTAQPANAHWRRAAPVPAFSTRAALRAETTLKEALAARAGFESTVEQEPTSRTVVTGESYPAKYRAIIRRYFELIRGPDADS